MDIVATHTKVIVPEVLRRGNYKRWSILMRYYLLGQDLWDVVQSRQLPAGGNMSGEWMKKNALALHAIMIACGEEIFDQIKEKDSAKDVWDALAAMHKPPDPNIIEAPQERRTGPGDLANSQYETLTNAISNGDLRQVKKFFRENSNPRSARIFEFGYTALHFAVYNKKSEIVDYLIVFKLSKKDLEAKDDSGSTALSIAARYGIGKSIAQKLVLKNDNLLTIPDNDKKIPVELACSTIREDLTRYLYLKTPLASLKSLERDRLFCILTECLTRKMFDIVFDLLHHFPELASCNCSLDSNQLILTLAKTPPPFFRGSNLSFWGRRIYNCIIVKADVIKEDDHRSCAEKMRDFFPTCRKMIQQCFKAFGDSIQEIIQVYRESVQLSIRQALDRETNQETDPDIIQGFRELPFKDKCVYLLISVTRNIGFSVGVLIGIVVLAVEISLAVPLILVGLIIGTLLMLATKIFWLLPTDLYKIKLMDVYASKVIQLICQPLPKLVQIQSVQSRAEKVTNQAIDQAIVQAIENGIPGIVKEIINANILWSSTDPEDSRSRIQKIFALAVKHRQEEVALLLYESEKEKNMLFTINEDGDNTLHLAAKLPPNYRLDYIYAAALQLQSELRWFRSVKEIVPVAYKERKNKDNEIPSDVFLTEHKDLLKEAEEWVKKTAESSTVVGALIITIMFAVAFSVPGGNDQSTGFPVLLHKTPTPFMIFMVSDAISLFTASSSVLMFLGILTSHHSDEDYRKTFLLIIGLTSLFVSIATMTTAFYAALFIMLQSQGGLGLLIPITLFAGIPIVCYVLLQFPLLVEIVVMTFSSNIFGKKGTSLILVWGTAGMVVWGTAGMLVWGTAAMFVWVVWGKAGMVVWGTAGMVVWIVGMVVWMTPGAVVRGTAGMVARGMRNLSG